MKEIKQFVQEQIIRMNDMIEIGLKDMQVEIDQLTDLTKVESKNEEWHRFTLRAIQAERSEAEGAIRFAWYNELINDEEYHQLNEEIVTAYCSTIEKCNRSFYDRV